MITMTKTEFSNSCNEFGCSWGKEFIVEWSTGGTRNDCWGGSYNITPESNQELESLDEFLTKYFPGISYLQYKAIARSVSTTTFSEGDYYGGSESKVKKMIRYKQLREVLVHLDLLEIIDESTEE